MSILEGVRLQGTRVRRAVGRKEAVAHSCGLTTCDLPYRTDLWEQSLALGPQMICATSSVPYPAPTQSLQ